MAFIVPNANNTGGGQTFANTNQAEPDSLDFEILGNRSSWVRSGGNVSSVSSSAVSVAAGVVVLDNVPYQFPAAALSIAPITGTSDLYRFDLIVARRATGSATAALTVVKGAENSANPVLPQSRSTLGTYPYSSGFHVDFATDVVLHAVLRIGSNSLTSANVVDKRIVDSRPVTYTSTTEPTPTTPGVFGDRIVYNGVGYTYLKDDVTRWYRDSLEATASDPVPPIGSIVCWAGAEGPPSSQITGQPRYLPCDGRLLTKTDFPKLENVLKTKYGGSSGLNFNLPNINDESTIYGVAVGASTYGTKGGENTLKLTEAHSPQHRHTLKTNGADNTHNQHKHKIRAVQLGMLDLIGKADAIGGGDRFILAKNDVGEEVVRRSEENEVGLGHDPQMGYYGQPSTTQTPVPLKGKHINLSWYIRVE
jgi:hypothetical protein